VLSTPDKDYHYLSWDEVQEIIKTNRLDAFQRVPSQLRRYREYTYKLKQEYGSVLRFVVNERLRWTNLDPRGAPFEFEEDYKILYNDWPYGIDKDIVHLVVWVKFVLEDDPDKDELTASTRKQMDQFVDRTFRRRVGSDRVVWFRNWKSIKSVHAVEHFHIMLYQADLGFIDEITAGDRPFVETIDQ